MEKHPWHFTSMKKLFGPCTKRLSLCLEASRAAGGLSKSISCASCFVRIIMIKREGMGQYTDLWAFKKVSMSIESPSILERDDAVDTRANPTAIRKSKKICFPTQRESKKKFCPLPFLGLSPSSRRRLLSCVGPSRRCKKRRTKNKCRPLKPPVATSRKGQEQDKRVANAFTRKMHPELPAFILLFDPNQSFFRAFQKKLVSRPQHFLSLIALFFYLRANFLQRHTRTRREGKTNAVNASMRSK
jgi:hypothetical protein